jgi:hypothetical protein
VAPRPLNPAAPGCADRAEALLRAGPELLRPPHLGSILFVRVPWARATAIHAVVPHAGAHFEAVPHVVEHAVVFSPSPGEGLGCAVEELGSLLHAWTESGGTHYAAVVDGAGVEEALATFARHLFRSRISRRAVEAELCAVAAENAWRAPELRFMRQVERLLGRPPPAAPPLPQSARRCVSFHRGHYTPERVRWVVAGPHAPPAAWRAYRAGAAASARRRPAYPLRQAVVEEAGSPGRVFTGWVLRQATPRQEWAADLLAHRVAACAGEAGMAPLLRRRGADLLVGLELSGVSAEQLADGMVRAHAGLEEAWHAAAAGLPASLLNEARAGVEELLRTPGSIALAAAGHWLGSGDPLRLRRYLAAARRAAACDHGRATEVARLRMEPATAGVVPRGVLAARGAALPSPCGETHLVVRLAADAGRPVRRLPASARVAPRVACGGPQIRVREDAAGVRVVAGSSPDPTGEAISLVLPLSGEQGADALLVDGLRAVLAPLAAGAGREARRVRWERFSDHVCLTLGTLPGRLPCLVRRLETALRADPAAGASRALPLLGEPVPGPRAPAPLLDVLRSRDPAFGTDPRFRGAPGRTPLPRLLWAALAPDAAVVAIACADEPERALDAAGPVLALWREWAARSAAAVPEADPASAADDPPQAGRSWGVGGAGVSLGDGRWPAFEILENVLAHRGGRLVRELRGSVAWEPAFRTGSGRRSGWWAILLPPGERERAAIAARMQAFLARLADLELHPRELSRAVALARSAAATRHDAALAARELGRRLAAGVHPDAPGAPAGVPPAADAVASLAGTLFGPGAPVWFPDAP